MNLQMLINSERNGMEWNGAERNRVTNRLEQTNQTKTKKKLNQIKIKQ